MYDVVIIGAGVVGSFVARQLARYRLQIALLEKNSDICCEATRANTAIVHSGYNGKPGSIKAGMTRKANEDFHRVCAELDVEFSRTGSLMIAVDETGVEKIHDKYKKGLQNGVQGMEIISGARALEMEPNLNPEVIAALYVPSTGVVNPWEFGSAAAENAVDNGVELFLNTGVGNIRRTDNGTFILDTAKGVFTARYVVNCAGLHSDEINNMVAEPFFRIAPRRGEYYVLDTEARHTVRRVIFTARKNEDIKGVIVAPTVHGNILVGPSTEDIKAKDDYRTTAEKLASVKSLAGESVRGIPYHLVIRSFSGIRPRPQLLRFNAGGEAEFYEDKVKDFILGEPAGCDNFINCAGIKSPGLTCANEIGKYVADLIKTKEGDRLKPNTAFNPRRRPVVRFHKLPFGEQQRLVRENPLYGHIVYRCRQITEAEIIDAVRRGAGATTVDGVKRRAGTALGRCQGGFCTPAVINILARELGIEPEKVRKDAAGSEILCGRLN